MTNGWISGFLSLLMLVGILGEACAQQSSGGGRERASVQHPPEIAAGVMDRSRQALGNELEESLRRAKERMTLEAQSYGDYLEQRLRLEKELKEAMVSELSSFELQFIESLRRQSQTVLQGKQGILLEQLQKFSKDQQEAVNVDVLAYEASRRNHAIQLIAEQEKKIRDEIQAAQAIAEERVLAEVRRQVAARTHVLQVGIEKRLKEIDRDYAIQGRVEAVKANKPSSTPDSGRAEAENRFLSGAVTSGEWDVTEADATFRSLLSRWTARAKWTLVWDSDIDLPISGNASFRGSLAKAISSAVDTVLPEKDRLVIKLFEKNKVVRVQRRY